MKKLIIFIIFLSLFSCGTPGKIELKIKVYYTDGTKEVISGKIKSSHDIDKRTIDNPIYLEEGCIKDNLFGNTIACDIRRFEILEKKVTYDN
jgi:hypothetical protein